VRTRYTPSWSIRRL